MVFFGDVITEDEPVTLDLHEGLTLHLRQVSLDTRSAGGEVTRLFARVNVREEEEEGEGSDDDEDTEDESSGDGSEDSSSSTGRQEFLLCTLDRKTPNYPLQLLFQSEDSPILFRVEGGSVHIVGNTEAEAGHMGDCDDADCEGCDEGEDDEVETEEEEDEVPELIEEAVANTIVVGSKRPPESSEQRESKASKVDASDSSDRADKKQAKKQKKQKKITEEEEPEVPIVVVSKPPSVSEAGSRKPWNVKPQNGEGVLVDKPKALGRSSGILLTEYVVGKGPVVRPGATVHITYEGMFPDGKVFDANLKRTKPFKFRQGTGQVIRGLDLALDGMRVGGSREVVIPPELG
jgi:FK506-binding nuclear protein